MTECVLVSRTPCNIFLVEWPSACDSELRRSFQFKLPREYWMCLFRGVSLDRLDTVLQQGIDVHPTNGVIWVDNLEKALEYGEWPKVVLALDTDCLKNTFREIPANSSEQEIMAVCLDFPTVVKSVDGSKLWCTRLPEDSPQIASDYEVAYARWIRGNPCDALKGVFIFHRPDDLAAIQALQI